MMPLQFELSGAYRDFGRQTSSGSVKLAFIERIVASSGFRMDGRKESTHGIQGENLFAEPLQLRVRTIAARFTAQHRLRQQSLSPQGNEALWIKIFGVQRPKTHGNV